VLKRKVKMYHTVLVALIPLLWFGCVGYYCKWFLVKILKHCEVHVVKNEYKDLEADLFHNVYYS
jgi:hypothetical protein